MRTILPGVILAVTRIFRVAEAAWLEIAPRP
jgi:hypothetical protein